MSGIEIIVLWLELLTVELPGEYDKESWAMDYEEKFAALPQLKEEGNQLYAGHEYFKAATKYSEALHMLEQLCLRWVSCGCVIEMDQLIISFFTYSVCQKVFLAQIAWNALCFPTHSQVSMVSSITSSAWSAILSLALIAKILRSVLA